MSILNIPNRGQVTMYAYNIYLDKNDSGEIKAN